MWRVGAIPIVAIIYYLKRPVSKKKKKAMQINKKTGKKDLYNGGKQAGETACENDQMLDLTDFKVDITNIFRKLKETIIKEVMQGLMTVSHQVKNSNTKIEMIKRKRRVPSVVQPNQQCLCSGKDAVSILSPPEWIKDLALL